MKPAVAFIIAITALTGFSFPASAATSTQLKGALSNQSVEPRKEPTWRITTFYLPITGRLSTTPRGAQSREYNTNGVNYLGAGLSYKDFGLKYSVPTSKAGETEFSDGGTRTSHFVTGLSQNFRNVRIRGEYARFQGLKLSQNIEDEYGDMVEYKDPSMRLENGLFQVSVGLKNKDFDFRKYEDYKDGSYSQKRVVYLFGFYQHHRFATKEGLVPKSLFSESAATPGNPTLMSGHLDTVGAGAGFIITFPVHRASFYLEANGGAGPEKQRSSWSDGEKEKVAPSARGLLAGGYGFLLTDWSVVDLNFEGSYTYSKVSSDEIRTAIARFLVSWTAKF